MQKAMVAVFAAAVLVSACASNNDTVTGTVPGANPGIVVNSPLGAGSEEPEVGPVEGGLTGADVGRSLSARDREIALQAEYEALEYGRPGQPTNWTSRSGNRGEIQVGTSYQVNRLDCREYTHNVYVGGRLRVVRGTACRQPDGVWRIVG